MEINTLIVWNSKTYNNLILYLESLSEEKYKEFSKKLISSKYEMLGIRIPIIRNLAKKISKTNFKDLFKFFDNKYYEIVLLEGLLISYISEYDEFVIKIREFVNKIDNWAICDTVVSSFKIINFEKDRFLSLVKEFILDKNEFTVRSGYVFLLFYYIDIKYLGDIFELIKLINRNDYYINMAISWLLCECYIKFPNETYKFINESNLNEFIIRKTCSKVNDSYRISIQNKILIKDLKDKKRK